MAKVKIKDEDGNDKELIVTEDTEAMFYITKELAKSMRMLSVAVRDK